VKTLVNIKVKLIKIQNLILKPIYKVYEWKLYREIKNKSIPVHIGFILNGNRRWASSLGLKPEEGHRYGFEKAKEVLSWCLELGVKTVTLYVFSTENFKRSRSEVEHIFNIAEKAFREVPNNPDIHKYSVRVKAIGRIEYLPESLREAIKKAEEATAAYSSRKLFIAIGYGGRSEIVDAIKKIIVDILNGKLRIDEVDEDEVSKHLYTAGEPDPDLIIRTSGEERLSNFLIWQCAYSELYFTDVHWPSFRKIDFWRIIRSYQRRSRRFGA